MKYPIVVTLFCLLLTGCVQPQREDRPVAKGAYLVIEGNEARAVLVFDGQRIEERGVVVDALRLKGEHEGIAASYVVETPNCGRLQWLTSRNGAADGPTRLLPMDVSGGHPDCKIASDTSRRWTALDYSG